MADGSDFAVDFVVSLSVPYQTKRTCTSIQGPKTERNVDGRH